MAVELYPERNCAKCTNEQKITWGCNGNAALPTELDGVLDFTCIARPLLDDPEWFNEIFISYKMYKLGYLPNEGSWLAQPIWFIQVVNIIEQTLDKCAKIKEESERRRNKNRGQREQLMGKVGKPV